MIPGEVLTADGTIELNAGRTPLQLTVRNTGDRPIQVGSHYHFAAVNPALSFDRDVARGYRLGIPAGTSVRFEPGVSMHVSLVMLGGRRVVPGLRADYAGALDVPGAGALDVPGAGALDVPGAGALDGGGEDGDG